MTSAVIRTGPMGKKIKQIIWAQTEINSFKSLLNSRHHIPRCSISRLSALKAGSSILGDIMEGDKATLNTQRSQNISDLQRMWNSDLLPSNKTIFMQERQHIRDLPSLGCPFYFGFDTVCHHPFHLMRFNRVSEL